MRNEREGTMRRSKLWLVAVPVFAIPMLAARPVEGQIRLSPWIGLYAPTNDLGSVQAIDYGKKASTLAYGADLELGGPGMLGFRLGGGYATNSEIDFDDVACIGCELRSTVLTATGGIVLSPLPLPVFRPYAVIGAGYKWYDFDFDGAIGSQLEDQGKFTWQVGLGAVVSPTGGLGVFAELSDFVSEIDFRNGSSGNTQHDLVLKAGLSFRLGGN
jgi:hypothetical protein